MANIDSVFDFMFTSPKEKVSIILYLVIVGFKFNHVCMLQLDNFKNKHKISIMIGS